jgi:hypothetical protein
MFKEVMLQWYGYYSGGGRVGEVLNQWQQEGIFSLLLPFLLIFALIYGILEKTKIFSENKAVNPVIAFIVGLVSIQFDLVPQFFSVIFPKLGVGLAILLVVIIILGVFLPSESWVTYTMFGIGAIILIVTLVYTADDLGWSAGYWWTQNWPTIAGAVFILVILGVLVSSSRDKTPFLQSASPFTRSLFNVGAPTK